ncbi:MULTISPECIES: terminase TerL endonuclease subunit [unclassified Chelatococcus]|uniref:terminase large subunit n=1 Tax=unclassified Chelatococcus TaxID=2638111 RepID=UPI0020C0C2AA|nr:MULTISPECIES: terminase TerL endonuclease subunit [unclassified Chelatococcus]MCO5077101.1 terminase large subunit [Chelatococcus sp.]
MTRGERNCRWIEKHCYIPEGAHIGRPVRLRPWQKDIIRGIYDNPSNTRRAIVSLGRKNAKTALSAFLLLLHLCGPEARPNSQLYSAAQSREQASVIFNLAAKCVRISASLRDYVTIKDSGKELVCGELGTKYRALSADAGTAYGLSPIFIVHDELGQVKGPRSELYEALETATGAQENPLSIVISTQAATDADLLSVLIDDAIKSNDPKIRVFLYTAPMSIDPFTEEAVKIANPAFGDFQNPAETLQMMEEARRLPSREAAYRNLVLNQRVELNSPFMPRAVWEACSAKPDHDFTGRLVYGGLDLSETTDLTALVLVAPAGGGAWDVVPTFWLPGDGLAERARADRVPYDVWADSGALNAIPDARSIEYDYIARYLRGVFDRYNVQKIAFDRYNFRHFRPCLIRAGFSEDEIEQRFAEFGQGFVSMSPALRALETLAVNQKLRHGGHPVLNMCAANAIAKPDDAGNRKLTKAQSRGRIDGMVSLAMAVGVASEFVEESAPATSPWDDPSYSLVA